MRAELERGIAALGLGGGGGELGERLLEYASLLGRWNRTYNLTAVREPVQVVRRHLLDSLVVLPHVQGSNLLDVGTGAGLPGLVLALARPAMRCALLDANAKKTRFCIQAAAELGLDNVEVVHSRVEDHRPATRYDTVISRAYLEAGKCRAQVGGLCRPGARILLMKGRYPHAELEELGPMRDNAEVVPLNVPGLGAERHLLILTVDACIAQSSD